MSDYFPLEHTHPWVLEAHPNIVDLCDRRSRLQREIAALDSDPEIPTHIRNKLGLGPAHPNDADRFRADLRLGVRLPEALERHRGREMICNAGFEFHDGSHIAYGAAIGADE